MSLPPITECVPTLLANMVFRSGTMTFIPNHSPNGQSLDWFIGTDILMAVLVPVCAMTILIGMFYACGFLASDDPDSLSGRFAKWRKAAEAGDGDAEFNLGVCFANGEGVPKDTEQSVILYRKAAEQGHPNAQYNLALSYYNGEGVPQDLAEAINWFRKAAAQGLPDACHSLGMCLSKGVGVPKDKEESVKWYFAAAQRGYAKSQFNLGLCYSGGHGVPKDHLMAYVWWNVSAASGSVEAARKRDALARRMTKEDVADAQRRCRYFLGQDPEPVEQRSETVFSETEFLAPQAA